MLLQKEKNTDNVRAMIQKLENPPQTPPPIEQSLPQTPTSSLQNPPQTPPPHRPDTVSAQLNISSDHIPPVPNYLGNIMVGDTLVPASGSFQCILTLPSSQALPLNLKVCRSGSRTR